MALMLIIYFYCASWFNLVLKVVNIFHALRWKKQLLYSYSNVFHLQKYYIICNWIYNCICLYYLLANNSDNIIVDDTVRTHAPKSTRHVYLYTCLQLFQYLHSELDIICKLGENIVIVEMKYVIYCMYSFILLIRNKLFNLINTIQYNTTNLIKIQNLTYTKPYWAFKLYNLKNSISTINIVNFLLNNRFNASNNNLELANSI